MSCSPSSQKRHMHDDDGGDTGESPGRDGWYGWNYYYRNVEIN